MIRMILAANMPVAYLRPEFASKSALDKIPEALLEGKAVV
jgi:hypothetical protein